MSEDKALQKLGYTRKWLEYGFLDAQLLSRQIADSHETDHDATEHYRYAAFIARIKLHRDHDIQDIDLTRFFELVQEDPDPVMAGSALGELLRQGKLTVQQIQRFMPLVPQFGSWLQRLIDQASFLLRLKQHSDDTGLIEQYLHNADSVVQEYLLCETRLTIQQLEILAEKGANRSLRNRAKEKLKQKPRP